MSEYFLIENLSNINKCIQQPLHQTHRIKYTTFDVTQNYIIFGASSGGIYIFSRHPCEFVKLIPTKEGAVFHLAVTLDERAIAISSVKGLIVVIDNFLTETTYRYQIFNEHEGKLITAMKWHFSELYCGDNCGNVSVISLTNILSKSIFQTPSAVLMHLDSCVVQLDVFSKFLLVSTKTKTYLCDTEEEQYRQIGKKLREGDFGACFYSQLQDVQSREREKTNFKILKDDERFSSHGIEGVKIFCARPGLRLWEADFNASVVCTYQFKTTINQTITEVINLDTKVNSRLNIMRMQEQDFNNFGRVYIALNKFLITFMLNTIVVLDVQGLNVLFKYSKYPNINDIKIVDNNIYIWDKNGIKILSIMNLEMVIMRTLSNKQYYLCCELCVKYNQNLKALLQLDSSENLTKLNILKEKLKNEKILDSILPMLDKIKESKPAKGIVKVENGFIDEPSCSYNNPPVKPIIDTNKILYKQYKVNKMYVNIEMPELNILSEYTLDDKIAIFNDFVTYVKENDQDDNSSIDVDKWCKIQYLKSIKDTSCINDLDDDSKALTYIFDAFKTINTSNNTLICKCKYPLPVIHAQTIEFYNVGCDLYKKLQKSTKLIDLLTSVPYMWREKLRRMDNINTVLPLLMQFSELKLLQTFMRRHIDAWEDAIRLLIKLKRNICLNCDHHIAFDVAYTFKWKYFALAMLEAIGEVNSFKLLQRYAKHIPNEELGYDFYQSCILAAVLGDTRNSRELVDKVSQEDATQKQLEMNIKKYLTRKHMGHINDTTMSNNVVKCTLCDLRLMCSVLEDCKLSCGHQFHDVCLKANNGVCHICVNMKN